MPGDFSDRVKTVVVAGDVVTPYGRGIGSCWKGLLSGETAIRRLDRFETKFFQSPNAATISDLDPEDDGSLVIQMLRPLLTEASPVIPAEAFLILATTAGEIDILEKYVLKGEGGGRGSCLNCLLKKVEGLSGVKGPGMVVSGACASSTIAVARAAAMIRSGERDCVLVVACDNVSEFVLAGFSSLMALDEDMARPFDENRRGLSIGEAAGFALLMSESRAAREKREVVGEVVGWGLSNDANHMTGPSRDGSGVSLAIIKALHSAGVSADAVGCLAAHGTGTVYNDSMEMKAFKTVFGTEALPAYSIKGGTGHTMGTAGLLEMVVAFQTLKEKVVPPTVNLRDVDEEARGWVFPEPREFNGGITVSINAGFGGINAVLVLKR